MMPTPETTWIWVPVTFGYPRPNIGPGYFPDTGGDVPLHGEVFRPSDADLTSATYGHCYVRHTCVRVLVKDVPLCKNAVDISAVRREDRLMIELAPRARDAARVEAVFLRERDAGNAASVADKQMMVRLLNQLDWRGLPAASVDRITRDLDLSEVEVRPR